jgi:hypothetical protein
LVGSSGKQQSDGTHILEYCKCAVLTVIAIVLVGLYLKTPVPFTIENIRSKKVEILQIPLVRVNGGHIDADVSGRVDVDN